MNSMLPNSSPPDGFSFGALAVRLGRIVGYMLLAYFLILGIFAIYQYYDKFALLSRHFSEATAHFLSIVILLVAIAAPIPSVLRILSRRWRWTDLLVVLLLPGISWLIAMIPETVGNLPLALSGNAAEQTYFVQGRPVVWFSDSQAACPHAWDRSGNHPQTNEVLVAATPELVAKYIACFKNEQARAKAHEQEEQRKREADEARKRREQAEARERSEAEATRQREAEALKVRESEPENARFGGQDGAKTGEYRLEQSPAMAQQRRATVRAPIFDRNLPDGAEATLAIMNLDCVSHELHLNGSTLGRINAKSERTFTVPAGASNSYMCRPGTERCTRQLRNNFAPGSQNVQRVAPSHCRR